MWKVYARHSRALPDEAWDDVTGHIEDDKGPAPDFEVILTYALRWKQQGQHIRLEFVPQ